MQYIYFLVKLSSFPNLILEQESMKHILDIFLENCYKIVR